VKKDLSIRLKNHGRRFFKKNGITINDFLNKCRGQKPPAMIQNPATTLMKKGKKKQEEKEYNLYLVPIRYDDLPNGRYFTSEEAAILAEKYYSLYFKWKREKLEEIKRNLRVIDQTTTKVACGVCGVRDLSFLNLDQIM
jgi:hypothetical protein